MAETGGVGQGSKLLYDGHVEHVYTTLPVRCSWDERWTGEGEVGGVSTMNQTKPVVEV